MPASGRHLSIPKNILVLEKPLALLKVFEAICGDVGRVLSQSWGVLACSWEPLGDSGGSLGVILGALEAIFGLGPLWGPSWGHLGPLLGPSWGLWRWSWCGLGLRFLHQEAHSSHFCLCGIIACSETSNLSPSRYTFCTFQAECRNFCFRISQRYLGLLKSINLFL